MIPNDQERLLNEILPNVAAQLRGSLGNMHAALLRMAPDAADAAAERNMAILSQSYYRAMRLVNNLSAAPMLLETTPFLTANVELVAWLDGLVRQAQPLAEETGVALRFQSSLPYHSVAIHKEHMERLVWNLLLIANDQMVCLVDVFLTLSNDWSSFLYRIFHQEKLLHL